MRSLFQQARGRRSVVLATALAVALTISLPALGVTLSAGTAHPPASGPGADGDLPAPDPDCSTAIARRLVVGGDGVADGAKDTDEELSTKTDRYSDVLLKKLQSKYQPWCGYNTADEATDSTYTVTTRQYQDDGNPTQQSMAHDLRPHLIVLTVGRDNAGIQKYVGECLDQVRDHRFPEAIGCGASVLADQPAFDKLRDELSEILNRYKVQMDGNPDLQVVVTGYFNPYPKATDVATKIPGFCADLQDTIPTCTIRWVMLPPALVLFDQITKKINDTIEPVVRRFEQASQGRFYFVNPYDKFQGHCMQMDVEIKTTVYHPTNTVHNHNATKDFGCEDKSWIEDDGDVGTLTPFIYLTPAVTGVLVLATQRTEHMGLYPNADGHKCLAGLIYEAKTSDDILLKNQLGIPEAAMDPEGC